MKINIKALLLYSFALFLLLLCFVGGPGYYGTIVYKEFWNLGHIVLFFLLGFLLYSYSERFKRQSLKRQTVVIFTLCLVLGGLIELLQGSLARSSDLKDMLNNFTGGLLAVVFCSSPLQWPREFQRRLVCFVSIVLLLLSITPVLLAAHDEWRAYRQFPLLADFEDSRELLGWKGVKFEQSSDVAFHGTYSLKVNLGTETYSGIGTTSLPRDWRGFKALKFAVFNTGQEISLTVRIHDVEHTRRKQAYNDRYNQRFNLVNGWNIIEVDLESVVAAPKDRSLDLAAVQQFGMFVNHAREPRVIYLDNVRLVK